ncbi:hypothetical protein DIS24_g9091 [Lasiodiplodia hormozganensis]|uniref:Uncharacterized protein n=1 Tax=Lasiodiplodia hormozganensis TaxID=869390 RepID=A0AA39XYZ4_9PEZI|nr:hypothetical protein DIS24_g9091 [Lasiodiplodia hormozganensis]
MSYNKNTRRTGARASAVPLPPPPPLTDLAEWPYLESSAARTRNASATATGGSNSAQQKLGDVSGGSLPRQDVSEAEAQDEYSMVTEQCTTNLTRQAVLEPEAQSGTAISRDSGMLAQEMPPEQQPGESFQELVDRHRTLALSVPVTWEDGGPSSLAPPNGDEPPPNNGAGASHPARDADGAPFPTEWWAALPEGLSPEKAKAVWLEKGRPNCTACGRAHPPPHNDLVARQNKQQRRRQQKLEHRAKQQAAAAATPEVKKEPEEAAPFTTRAQSSAAAGKRQNNRCQRCGNFHSGPCRAPWCDKCGSAHFKKKGEPCKKRDKEVIAGAVSAIQDDPALARDLAQADSERPGTSEEMRTLMAAILASGDPAQAAAMTRAYVELRDERAASQQQQQQQQQQQDRPPPRQNQRGRSSHRPRGRSASPRREGSGGGGSYRERSPNMRRNNNKGGGRGPSRRSPRNG